MSAGTERLSGGSITWDTVKGQTREQELWKQRDVKQVTKDKEGEEKEIMEEEVIQDIQDEDEKYDEVKEEEDQEEAEEEAEEEEGVTGGQGVQNHHEHYYCKNIGVHSGMAEVTAEYCYDYEKDVKAEIGEVNFNVQVRCPLYKISPTLCLWSGTLGNLGTHVTGSHEEILRKSPNFVCKSVKDNVLLVLCNAEIFLYYKRFRDDGMCYAAIQQVGTTNKKYRCTMKLLSVENTIGSIVITFLINDVSADFGSVFHAGRCMAIERIVLKPFIKDDQISMIVTIEEVNVQQ